MHLCKYYNVYTHAKNEVLLSEENLHVKDKFFQKKKFIIIYLSILKFTKLLTIFPI